MNQRHCARWMGPILLLALVGCTPGGEDKSTGSPTPGSSSTPIQASTSPPRVVVATAQKRDIEVAQEYTATTVASQTVEIRSRVTGTLMGPGFQEGTRVNAGQVLFQIDPAQYQADLLQSQAQVSRARADLAQALNQVNVKKSKADVARAQASLKQTQQDVDRYKPLALKQIIPQQTMDNAVANRNVAQAQLDAALAELENTRISDRSSIAVARANLQAAQAQVTSQQIKLGYCTITAPVSGIIGRLQVDPGNVVGPSDQTAMAVISQNDPMYAEFSISEVAYLAINKILADQQSGRVQAHGRLPFQLVLADGSVYPRSGRFVLAERGLDAKTGTLLVRVSYPNPMGLLKPGQFARIKVAAQATKGAVLVPQKAVTELQSMQAVYVVGPDMKVATQTIETSGTYEDMFIVKEGLKGGEMVIVDGLQKVRPGQLCDPTDKPSAGK